MVEDQRMAPGSLLEKHHEAYDDKKAVLHMER